MIVVGLSHRSAPLDIRERIALDAERAAQVVKGLVALDTISEAVALATCNRTEIYAQASTATTEPSLVISAITDALGKLGGYEVAPYLVSRSGKDALSHLFRVAASLDSLVVGEPQILGQLKDAIRIAKEAKTLGPNLGSSMRAAVKAAKRVRTETAIGEGQVSVPSVAVDLARQIFENVTERVALMIGAGEMAETAAKLLARAGASLLVVNRSPERAEQLAHAVGGQTKSWSDMDAALTAADIVITSTASPKQVVSREQLSRVHKGRRGRSLFLIDIAVPRDVDPAVNDLDNVYLYDIDDLSHVVAQALKGRADEAARAEAIVGQQVEQFAARQQHRSVLPVIVSLRAQTKEVLMREVERSCKGRLKHLSATDRNALSSMIDAAINKLLHAPSQRLKELANREQGAECAQLLSEIFQLDDLIAQLEKDDDPEISVDGSDIDDRGEDADAAPPQAV